MTELLQDLGQHCMLLDELTQRWVVLQQPRRSLGHARLLPKSLLRHLPILARLCRLGMLQPLLHVSRHGRPWHSSHGRRLRSPCYHIHHCLSIPMSLSSFSCMPGDKRPAVMSQEQMHAWSIASTQKRIGLWCVFERTVPCCRSPGRICWPSQCSHLQCVLLLRLELLQLLDLLHS